MGSSFDGVGGLLAAPIMAALNSDMERAAVALAQPEDGARYLVLGFGGGVGITALLDVVEPGWVLALDPSEAMHRPPPNASRATRAGGASSYAMRLRRRSRRASTPTQPLQSTAISSGSRTRNLLRPYHERSARGAGSSR